jgi:hypothetical protein
VAVPVHPGTLLAVDGASAVLDVTTWDQDALERIILGDRTGRLNHARLPGPDAPGARDAVTALVKRAAAAVPSCAGLRSQLFLQWPACDTRMHPMLLAAGLDLDAVWALAPGTAPGRGATCAGPCPPRPGR